MKPGGLERVRMGRETRQSIRNEGEKAGGAHLTGYSSDCESGKPPPDGSVQAGQVNLDGATRRKGFKSAATLHPAPAECDSSLILSNAKTAYGQYYESIGQGLFVARRAHKTIGEREPPAKRHPIVRTPA
jgi:hypothetical protein